MRRNNGCTNCGEVREIAAHGLCFKCYRREERTADRPVDSVDRHNPGIRREHKKLFRGFTGVMVGLSDLGVAITDVLAIRRILEPYTSPIAKFLALAPERGQTEGKVNSEHDCQNLFTARTGSDAKEAEP
jgi:hypothetical protein